jgi:hypothetical protein
MKKQYIIDIETNNMAPVYDSEDVSQHIPEHEKLGFFEEQIVIGIKLWLKEQLRDEFLNQAILDGLIPEFDFQGVEGWADLSQYGTIKITLIDEGNSEVICYFQREKIPLDEEYVENEAEEEIVQSEDEKIEEDESEEDE